MPIRVIELAEELNILEPQRMYERTKQIYGNAENMADCKNQNSQDYTNVGNT